MRSVVRGVVGAGVGLAVGLAAGGARAQVRGRGFDFQMRVELLALHLRAPPAAGYHGTSDRTSTGVAVTMLGFAGGGDLIIGDRVVIPLLMTEAGFAVGRYPTVYATSEGRVTELRPWNSAQFNMLIGGIGARWKHRRWAWSALLQPGLSATYTQGQRATEDEPEQMISLSLLVRPTVAGCRRLDPETRVCVFGGPNAYLGGWFNGGVVGVRLEYGP